ncbi:hypothetical protein FJY90_06830, partial [Candidatus Gottesmanbacteria bacterium]|nr:hypothetical protein [Candidatus Gottesmanbacteria bacterium]
MTFQDFGSVSKRNILIILFLLFLTLLFLILQLPQKSQEIRKKAREEPMAISLEKVEKVKPIEKVAVPLR